MIALRILVAAVVTVALMLGAVAWAERRQPEPDTKTVVVTKTPAGCEKFARSADAFVEVTADFLELQNDALDAVIDQDGALLETTVASMEVVSDRFDAVNERYSNTRAGCL